MTATAGFLMIYLVSDCKPYGNDPTDNPIQMYCNDGEQLIYVFGWKRCGSYQSIVLVYHIWPLTSAFGRWAIVVPIFNEFGQILILLFSGEYHVLGAIWFQTPEQSVRSLFHDPPGSHRLAKRKWWFLLVFTASRGFKIFTLTFICEYFRLQNCIKHSKTKYGAKDYSWFSTAYDQASHTGHLLCHLLLALLLDIW